MCHQVHNRFFQISQQSAFRDVPDLDGAVFRSAGNDVVIMWAPLYVEYGRTMTDDQRCISIYSPGLSAAEHNVACLEFNMQDLAISIIAHLL